MKSYPSTHKPRTVAGVLVSGLQSLWGGLGHAQTSQPEEAIHGIRASMQSCLMKYGAADTSLVYLRVTYAAELQDLWYLRGDVLAYVASSASESLARKELSWISDQFKGALPKGYLTRSSPLSS